MKTKTMLLYLSACLVVGCVPVLSLHPLFTEKDIVFEEKLLGAWADESDGVWEFAKLEEPVKAYEFRLTDDEGRRGLFVARLVKLKDKLFLDVMPKQFPCSEEDVEKTKFMYNSFFFVPAHMLLRVDSIEPKLAMRWANVDKIQELLEKDPNAVRHEVLEDTVVLTASTKELQRFVLKYSDDEEIFSSDVTLHRKKAPKPDEEPASGQE